MSIYKCLVKNWKYSIFGHFTHRSQIVIKMFKVLVVSVNLGFILPSPVDYSYLQVDL